MKISNYQEGEDGVKVQNDSTHDDGKGERGGGRRAREVILVISCIFFIFWTISTFPYISIFKYYKPISCTLEHKRTSEDTC